MKTLRLYARMGRRPLSLWKQHMVHVRTVGGGAAFLIKEAHDEA